MSNLKQLPAETAVPLSLIVGICKARDLCRDLDDDCDGVDDKHACAAYDPSHGICPYVTGHPEFCNANNMLTVSGERKKGSNP